MKKDEVNLLFFTRSMGLGGTENVILQLCEILQEKVDHIVVVSCGGVNVEKLEKMGVKHVCIPDIVIREPKTILKVFTTLLRTLKKENISIVHTHHRMAAFYARILRHFHKFEFISTAHNIFHDKIKFTHYSYEKAEVIAVGQKVKDNLCNDYGLLNSQVTVIHNAIRKFTGPIKIEEQWQKFREEGYALVANIGRISAQKGFDYFVRSIPFVIAKEQKVKFIIVGDGEDTDKIKKLVKELRIEKYVIFAGYRKDVQNVISQMDFIVLSSLWEGFPLIPIEAFSVGKPVIATAIDGTTEIVSDNFDGLLVPAKDSRKMADAITFLLENKELQKKLGDNALLTYDQEYDFCILHEKYLTFYAPFIKESKKKYR